MLQARCCCIIRSLPYSVTITIIQPTHDLIRGNRVLHLNGTSFSKTDLGEHLEIKVKQ